MSALQGFPNIAILLNYRICNNCTSNDGRTKAVLWQNHSDRNREITSAVKDETAR